MEAVWTAVLWLPQVATTYPWRMMVPPIPTRGRILSRASSSKPTSEGRLVSHSFPGNRLSAPAGISVAGTVEAEVARNRMKARRQEAFCHSLLKLREGTPRAPWRLILDEAHDSGSPERKSRGNRGGAGSVQRGPVRRRSDPPLTSLGARCAEQIDGRSNSWLWVQPCFGECV